MYTFFVCILSIVNICLNACNYKKNMYNREHRRFKHLWIWGMRRA